MSVNLTSSGLTIGQRTVAETIPTQSSSASNGGALARSTLSIGGVHLVYTYGTQNNANYSSALLSASGTMAGFYCFSCDHNYFRSAYRGGTGVSFAIKYASEANSKYEGGGEFLSGSLDYSTWEVAV